MNYNQLMTIAYGIICNGLCVAYEVAMLDQRSSMVYKYSET